MTPYAGSTQEEWAVIGRHDHTFPGITATTHYAIKATLYAAALLEFMDRCGIHPPPHGLP